SARPGPIWFRASHFYESGDSGRSIAWKALNRRSIQRASMSSNAADDLAWKAAQARPFLSSTGTTMSAPFMRGSPLANASPSRPSRGTAAPAGSGRAGPGWNALPSGWGSHAAPGPRGAAEGVPEVVDDLARHALRLRRAAAPLEVERVLDLVVAGAGRPVEQGLGLVFVGSGDGFGFVHADFSSTTN